jgi:hypothetical protein
MATNNSSNQPTGTSGKVMQAQGAGVACSLSTATYPATATGAGTLMRADGTNWVASTSTYPNTNAVNTLLYASSANVMAALATANSGVLTTDASGVPSIDTTNFVRQTTGMQMKGNNTNTTPPAGFIGERISSGLVTGVSISNNTATQLTSISLTAGIWDVTGIANFVPSVSAAAVELSINTVNNVINTNVGDQSTLLTNTAAVYTNCTLTVPNFRVLLSATTTYYLVGLMVFTTTGTVACRLSAVRVG